MRSDSGGGTLDVIPRKKLEKAIYNKRPKIDMLGLVTS